jgi:hypothetical protein
MRSKMEGEREKDLRRGPFVISREHRHVRPVAYCHVGSVTCTIRARAAIAFWFLSRPQSSCGRGKRAGKARQRRGEASLGRSMERRRFVPPDLRRDGSQRNVLNVRHVRDSPAFPVSTHSMNRWDLYNPRP